MEIHCLCTGNVCRSPVAEAMLRERLARRGVDAVVTSSGTIAAGRPASEHSVELLAERGTDLSAFLSSVTAPERLRAADLVVAMARAHVREAVVMVPEVWPRTFTIKELVRRGEAVGPRAAHVPIEAWLARAHEGRALADTLGDSPADDVEDPIGRPRRAYVRMVEELDDLTSRLVELLWPSWAGPEQVSAPRPGGPVDSGG